MRINTSKIVVASSTLLFSMLLNVCQAAPLAKESEEYKQLEAMGYDISPTKEGDTGTTVKSTGAILYIEKGDNFITFTRTFNRKRLSDEDESKLLRIVNQMNQDLSTQVSLGPAAIFFMRSNLGPHNAKGFAANIRILEKTDQTWGDYPTLLPLLNK